ncbi:MAG: hypothetical protein MI976_07740 [Pseudomonadales bacterium]|nr:hypothetical protein [Pseudomonadales bacterium]
MQISPIHPHRRLTQYAFLILLLAGISPAFAQSNTIDLAEFLDHVALRTQSTIILHPRLRSKTTIMGDNLLESANLMAVTEVLLDVHGFALVKESPHQFRVTQKRRIKSNPMHVTEALDKQDHYQTFLFKLHNLDALTLTRTLKPLIPRQGGLYAVNNANVLILIGTQASAEKIAQLLQTLDNGSNTPNWQIDSIQLTNSNATDLSKTLEKVFEKRSRFKRRRRRHRQTDTSVTFTPFPEMNRILIAGKPSDRYRAQKLIQSLDIAKATKPTLLIVPLENRNVANIAPIIENLFPKASQKPRRRLRSRRFRQQQPHIKQLTSLPYEPLNSLVLTGQATSNNSNPFNAIERKDVGIELTLTPTLIPESSKIHLDVNLEVSAISLAAQVNGASDIITNKRKIDTNLNIKSGSTLVLGGLISENQQHSESTIPGLTRLPIVGSLFNSTRKIYDKKILVAFVTAEIQDPEKI